MQQRGFTLIEVMAVLMIISIVMLAAFPSFSAMRLRHQSISELNRLVGAVNLTRHSAVQYASTTTLCGLKANGKCGAPWSGKLTVFLDHNENAFYDDNDETINFVHSLNTESTVKWRSFQNRQYLQMTASGYTNYQNGNFVVCPANADTRQAKQLVINIQGRARVNHSVNEAGLPVDRKGKVLRC